MIQLCVLRKQIPGRRQCSFVRNTENGSYFKATESQYVDYRTRCIRKQVCSPRFGRQSPGLYCPELWLLNPYKPSSDSVSLLLLARAWYSCEYMLDWILRGETVLASILRATISLSGINERHDSQRVRLADYPYAWKSAFHDSDWGPLWRTAGLQCSRRISQCQRQRVLPLPNISPSIPVWYDHTSTNCVRTTLRLIELLHLAADDWTHYGQKYQRSGANEMFEGVHTARTETIT